MGEVLKSNYKGIILEGNNEVIKDYLQYEYKKLNLMELEKDLTILYTDTFEGEKNSYLEKGYHEIFWQIKGCDRNRLLIAYNGKCYIFILCGSYNWVKNNFILYINKLVTQINTKKGEFNVNKKVCNYNLWG